MKQRKARELADGAAAEKIGFLRKAQRHALMHEA